MKIFTFTLLALFTIGLTSGCSLRKPQQAIQSGIEVIGNPFKSDAEEESRETLKDPKEPVNVKEAPKIKPEKGQSVVSVRAPVNPSESSTLDMEEITWEPVEYGGSIIAFTRKESRIKANTGASFEPPKGPSPSDKALGKWPIFGAGLVVLGIFFCTPWGGMNFRVGLMIAVGGAVMALIPKLIDKITLDAPILGVIFLLLAGALYWGYRVRQNQKQED